MQFSLIFLSILSMYKVDWVNQEINIPLYSDTFLYYDLPYPILMLGDTEITDELYYIEQGVNRTSLRVVNSNHVKTFKIDYRVTYESLGLSFDVTIIFNIVDLEPPTILKVPTIKMPVKSKLLSEKTILEEVFYKDNYYSNEELIVKVRDLSLVNVNVPKIYEIIFEVTDPSFNTTTLIGYYEIVNDNAPTIKSNGPIVLEYGINFDHYKYFSYYDEFDNNLIIDVNTSNVDFSKVGEYPLSVKVTNNVGLSSYISTVIKIVDTKKPVLIINDKYTLEVLLYDYNYLKSLIIDFYDNYDSLTLNDILINSNIDFNITGKYDVYYSLEDSSLNKVEKHVTIEIIDNTKPIITKYEDDITINVNSSNINWLLYLDYSDNYNEKEDLLFKVNEKLVNFKELGTYYIEVEVSDLSKNKRVNLISINVVDQTKPEVTQMREIILNDYTHKELNSFKAYFAISDNYNSYDEINIINTTLNDFSKTGFFLVSFIFSDQSNNLTIIESEVYIIDDLPPVIKILTNEITVNVNSEKLNLESYILNYSDNYNTNNELQINIISNIDYENIGEYLVNYEIKDSSNNIFNEILVVKVDLEFENLITGNNVSINKDSYYEIDSNITLSSNVLSYEVYPSSIDTSLVGTNEVLFIVYDKRGNYQQFVQIVEVVDNNQQIEVKKYLINIGITFISVLSLSAIIYMHYRKHDNL